MEREKEEKEGKGRSRKRGRMNPITRKKQKGTKNEIKHLYLQNQVSRYHVASLTARFLTPEKEFSSWKGNRGMWGQRENRAIIKINLSTKLFKQGIVKEMMLKHTFQASVT